MLNGLILPLADTVRSQQHQSPTSGFQVVSGPERRWALWGAGASARRCLSLSFEGVPGAFLSRQSARRTAGALKVLEKALAAGVDGAVTA